MNAEEASLLWTRKDEVDQVGGPVAHRQLALKHLKLKTVIKVVSVRCTIEHDRAHVHADCGLVARSCTCDQAIRTDLNGTFGATGEPRFACASVGV